MPSTLNGIIPHRDPAAWRAWEDRKRTHYPATVGDLIVEVRDPAALSPAEVGALTDRCRKANMAIYAVTGNRPLEPEAIRRLGVQFGLNHLDENLYADEDAISSLQVADAGRQRDYIPYTTQALNWHTDGYYNPVSRRIRAFVLHCVRPALAGGVNACLDHEMAFLLLHEAHPDHVAALMEDGVMTIPPNREGGVELRAESTGPVFYLDEATGRLGMRYTLRKRHVNWRGDARTRAALTTLETLLTGDCPYVFRHKLEAGQGIICNNVLHSRTAFEDDPAEGQGRLLYRARYYDRIAQT